MMRLATAFITTCLLLTSALHAAAADEQVNYTRDVRPILADLCYTCHGPDENARATDLRLDQQESAFSDLGGYRAIVPGDTDVSDLIHRITSDDPDIRMPPVDEQRQLKPEQIDTLVRWIAQGAEWEEHWSLVPPERPPLPDLSNRDWRINEIDDFVLARLEQEGLTPSPTADKPTLLRRVTLDLTGLPPTLEELDAFLADDSPQAWDTVVDRLLNSHRFGEHWATGWLDAARYADSNGYQGERTRTVWPWRDWVIRAFNNNMPFDRFTIDQIAGDLLPDPTREQLIATGFNRNHMLNGEGGRIAEESRVNYVIDRVNTTSATWLGITMTCCQCHDHKYDPFTQTDFYRLYAYFNSIDENGAVDAGGNANPVLAVPTPTQESRESDLSEQLATLQDRMRPLTTADRRSDWETEFKAHLADPERTSYWTPLVPTEFSSMNGQTLELLDDGALFVSGENPDQDNYSLVCETDLDQVTGLRLDVLHHESFTNGGLARSDSGNFVLTDVEISVVSRDGETTAVVIASAAADFEQGVHTVTNAFDDNPASGWAVYKPGDMQHDRAAVFVFAEPIPAGPTTRINITLKHESPHRNHNIGQFRISLSTQPEPQLDGSTDPPAEVLAALNAAPGERTPEQNQDLDEYYWVTDTEIISLQREIDAARESLNRHRNSYVKTMVMRDRAESRKTHRLIRGVWNNPDTSELLGPGVPAVLPALGEDAPGNRLALARWLVSPENPLTARVTVNRFWQQFFGVGLVKTSEDFGTQGELPSHPQLLDWLAVQFIRGDASRTANAAGPWNIKQQLRLIVTSATYRQSSVTTPGLVGRDPGNRLLARSPRFRMTSQMLRDQALFLSGLLVEQQGGPPVRPYQPEGVWLDLTLGKIRYEQDHGDALYRRSIYTFWRRSVAPTMLFDVPARQVCVVKQSRTNTPLHALTLMNETTFVESARKLAERVTLTESDTASARLSTAFRMATCRQPTEQELAALLALLDATRARFEAYPDQAAELLAVGESEVDDSIAPSELAAWASVMSVILNLDETLTKE